MLANFQSVYLLMGAFSYALNYILSAWNLTFLSLMWGKSRRNGQIESDNRKLLPSETWPSIFKVKWRGPMFFFFLWYTFDISINNG